MSIDSGPSWSTDAALTKYADMVRRICFLHLSHREDVEDVFQDTFISHLQRKAPFESEEHEKAWLIQVAIHRCSDLTRGFWRRRIVKLDENIAAAVPEESHDLLKTVLRLPPNERNAIFLFYYEGYAVTDIARVLGKNVNTVYSFLHRARARMRKQLGGLEDENEHEKSI